MVRWQLSHWELSDLTVVRSDSCPHWQLSDLTIVWSYRCPIWQLISDSCLPTDYFYAKGLLGLGRSPSLEPGEYDGSLDEDMGFLQATSGWRQFLLILSVLWPPLFHLMKVPMKRIQQCIARLILIWVQGHQYFSPIAVMKIIHFNQTKWRLHTIL